MECAKCHGNLALYLGVVRGFEKKKVKASLSSFMTLCTLVAWWVFAQIIAYNRKTNF